MFKFDKTTDVDEDTNFNEAMLPCPPVLKDNGLKRHIVIDTLGLVLVVLVHAANVANVTEGSENSCGRSFFKPICESLSGKLSRRSLTESFGCQLQLELVQRSSKKFEQQLF